MLHLIIQIVEVARIVAEKVHAILIRVAGLSLENGLDPPGRQVFQLKLIYPSALDFESGYT